MLGLSLHNLILSFLVFTITSNLHDSYTIEPKANKLQLSKGNFKVLEEVLNSPGPIIRKPNCPVFLDGTIIKLAIRIDSFVMLKGPNCIAVTLIPVHNPNFNGYMAVDLGYKHEGFRR